MTVTENYTYHVTSFSKNTFISLSMCFLCFVQIIWGGIKVDKEMS